MGFPGGSLVKYLPANAGDRVRYLIRKISHSKKQLNPCVLTTEPVLQSLGTAIREVTAVRSLHIATRQ